MTLLQTIKFELAPVPFMRPTIWRGRTLTPKQMRVFMKDVGMIAKAAMGSTPPYDFPLEVSLAFFIERPERFRKRELPDIPPDLSNYIKSIEDGCNGIVWTDDRRIVALSAEKYWAIGKPSIFMQIFQFQVGGEK